MMKMILRWIPLCLLALLYLAALELNKNSLWGFAAAVLAFGLYMLFYSKVMAPATQMKGALSLSGGSEEEIVRASKPFGIKLLGFLGLLCVLGLIFWKSWPSTKAIPAVDVKNPVVTEVVSIKDGQITGLYNEDRSVKVYAGIPYAAPPVGDLRWREPQDPAPWTGIKACDTFAPMSMQPVNLPIYNSLAQIIGYHDYKISLSDNFVAPVSEDALYLNIWQPAAAKEGDQLPVIVYIHGGSLQTGQPWYDDYRGETLAGEGVIVVNMGYRLGVFGFLADEQLAAESANHTTGNYGLLDQQKALSWVQENIASFGGDPSNVTVAGESAGAACVSALLASPLSKGLFQRAVLESSTVAAPEPAHSFRLFDEALQSGAELKKRFGVSTAQELRAVPAEKLVSEASTQHHITVDGYVLPETPYEAYQDGTALKVPVLHGFNAHEAAAFIIFSNANLKNYEDKISAAFGNQKDAVLKLYPASSDEQAKENWEQIYSAALFAYGHYSLSKAAISQGAPVYEYFFTQENGRLGAWHSGEEVYLYGNIPADSDLYTEADRLLSRRMVQYYVNFAWTGDPNEGPSNTKTQIGRTSAGDELPYWAPQTDPGYVYRLNESPTLIEEPYLTLYQLLEKR